MHKSQNVFLPKENSVNYIRQNLRMGSIQTVNSSVTVSLFVIVTFYWGNGTSEKYKNKKIKYLSTSM